MSDFRVLSEVFGYSPNDDSVEAERARSLRLCPFHNVSLNCTKNSKTDPLGVCSIMHGGSPVITCPIRFTQDHAFISEAAGFLFPRGTRFTPLREVRMKDRNGRSVGNIDYVLVAHDELGNVLDFGAVEVQAVYITGNITNVFRAFMAGSNLQESALLGIGTARPDYLSSSRKRLAPQLLFKGGILHGWGKKQVVILQSAFFETLPKLTQVSREEAEIAWMLFDIAGPPEDPLRLTFQRSVYTKFEAALVELTVPLAGPIEDFQKVLERKLRSGEHTQNVIQV